MWTGRRSAIAARSRPTIQREALAVVSRRSVMRRDFWTLALDEKMVPSLAPQRRAAPAIASNTGWIVGRRAGDDPRISRGRRLLLERLGELAVARLELLEQADVLDRDHRLGGEGLEQLDLLVRERPRARPPDEDAAQGRAVPQERHHEDCPDPIVVQAKLHEPAEAGTDGGAQVPHVDRPLLENRAADRRVRPDGVRVAEPLRAGKQPAVNSHEAMVIALEQMDRGVRGLT